MNKNFYSLFQILFMFFLIALIYISMKYNTTSDDDDYDITTPSY